MGCVCATAARSRQEKVTGSEGDLRSEAGGEEQDDLDQLDIAVPASKDGTGKISEINQKIFKVFGGSMSLSTVTPVKGSSGAKFQGTKISIFAFEVANTVGKAANLIQSLSDESMQFLKSAILSSQGVRQLVSCDTMHLLMIVASDQREEFRVFSNEVARFGKLCKDSQWHNLDCYFQKMDLDRNSDSKLKQEATSTIQELTILAQHTCELYHELNALDRIEQDYRRKLREEESMPPSLRGEGLIIYHTELKRQKKLIKRLKKTSLWSRNLSEIVDKLVEIVRFLNGATFEVPCLSGTDMTDYQATRGSQTLGSCGLALHYANIINQITNIVSRPLSFNQNTRDTFYNGLPVGIKAALRSRLQQFNVKGEMSSAQIKAEMHKILQWLSPLSECTIKAHQSFGWVGEFAKSGIEFNHTPIYTRGINRIQTLHHADKEKTEEFILQLVVWLHHLVKQVKERGYGGLKNAKPAKYHPQKYGKQPPKVKALPPSPSISMKATARRFSQEEGMMLEGKRPLPRSKSLGSIWTKEGQTQGVRRTRSSSSSPSRDPRLLKWTQMSNSLQGLEVV